jgi:hypothetical protein
MIQRLICLVFCGLACVAPAFSQEFGLQIGHDMRIFSTRPYHNYRTAALTVAFDDLWSPFGSSRFGVELRLGYLWGSDIVIVCDQLPVGSPGCEDGQDDGGLLDLDHWAVGVLPLWRKPLGKGWEVEGGIGMTWTDPLILEAGTSWHVLLMAGVRYQRPSWTSGLTLGLRFEHISNGGTIGLTDKAVIGLESVNAVVGWRF